MPPGVPTATPGANGGTAAPDAFSSGFGSSAGVDPFDAALGGASSAPAGDDDDDPFGAALSAQVCSQAVVCAPCGGRGWLTVCAGNTACWRSSGQPFR